MKKMKYFVYYDGELVAGFKFKKQAFIYADYLQKYDLHDGYIMIRREYEDLCSRR